MSECQTLLKPSLIDEEATDGLGHVISLDVGPEWGHVWDMCRRLVVVLFFTRAGGPICWQAHHERYLQCPP